MRLVVAAALLGLGLVVAEPAVSAAEAAGCDAAQIAVVVSFNSLPGGNQTTCIGDVSSGLAALGTAGFSYTFVDRQPGLVCTINAQPNPCNGAPTNAYWSYWTGNLGGSWAYSNLGAGNRNPAPGSAEGWSFGAGNPPALGPPSVAAPPPPPPPPPAPPPPAPAPAPPGGGSGGGGPGASTEPGGSGSAPGATDADPSAPAGESGTDPSDSTDSTSSAQERDRSQSSPADADALQPVSDSTSSGTPWGVVGTLAGLATLGGAAYWQQRRRKHARPGAGA